jgi:hypothetical protein
LGTSSPQARSPPSRSTPNAGETSTMGPPLPPPWSPRGRWNPCRKREEAEHASSATPGSRDRSPGWLPTLQEAPAILVGEQHGCLLERHPAPPTCCGTPAGGFFVLPHRTASGGGPCPGGGCPGSPPAGGSCRGAPASTADRARPASSTRGRRSLQSRPVASASFSASTAATTPGAGCGSVRPGSFCGRRMRGRPGGPIGRWGPSNRPAEVAMTGLAARPSRRSGPAAAGCWWWCGVLFQRSSLGVPGRIPARSPDQYRGDQRGNQHDQQDPAKGPQASGLARGRLGSSRRRGSGGCRQRRRRCRRLDRCRRPGGGRRPDRCWRLSGGPGR